MFVNGTLSNDFCLELSEYQSIKHTVVKVVVETYYLITW